MIWQFTLTGLLIGTLVQLAAGTFRSLSPLSSSTVASAVRSSACGSRSVKWLEIQTPGIEPTSSHPVARHRATLTSASESRPEPANIQSVAAREPILAGGLAALGLGLCAYGLRAWLARPRVQAYAERA